MSKERAYTEPEITTGSDSAFIVRGNRVSRSDFGKTFPSTEDVRTKRSATSEILMMDQM